MWDFGFRTRRTECAKEMKTQPRFFFLISSLILDKLYMYEAHTIDVDRI